MLPPHHDAQQLLALTTARVEENQKSSSYRLMTFSRCNDQQAVVAAKKLMSFTALAQQ
jgi:hypothetical protein